MSDNTAIYSEIRDLRQQGLTYTEINTKLTRNIPKSSLSYICKNIRLTTIQKNRIEAESRERLEMLRKKAVASNHKKFNAQIELYRTNNADIEVFMQDRHAKMVALAMLYLGEGAKWQKSRAPKLASTNPTIIRMYITLLRECYGVTSDKLRARVQLRADQDTDSAVRFWSVETGIKQEKFYRSYVDKRTIGKVTTKPNYNGVCTVMCAGTHIQLELAEIAGIIDKALTK